MLSDMRGAKLDDEIKHVKQLLDAAGIEVTIKGDLELKQSPALVEDVLSMCLKEAVTNVVKHSEASHCLIDINESPNEVKMLIQDDGVGIDQSKQSKGHGLRGISERLEFVNGKFNLKTNSGTRIEIQIPNVTQQINREDAR
ncbi:sensor histidine kinase [Piscibacillus salipiscarius]